MASQNEHTMPEIRNQIWSVLLATWSAKNLNPMTEMRAKSGPPGGPSKKMKTKRMNSQVRFMDQFWVRKAGPLWVHFWVQLLRFRRPRYQAVRVHPIRSECSKSAPPRDGQTPKAGHAFSSAASMAVSSPIVTRSYRPPCRRPNREAHMTAEGSATVTARKGHHARGWPTATRAAPLGVSCAIVYRGNGACRPGTTSAWPSAHHYI